MPLGPEALAAHLAAASASGGTPPALLDVREDAAYARGHLAGSGHLPAAALRERRGELPPRDRALVVVADDAATAATAAHELAATGWREVAWLDAPLASLAGGTAATGPPARLWRPSPFLESVLGELPRGRVLDLACGAGREAAFLALHGFEVEAWDHDDTALRRAVTLAAGVGARIATRRADLERPDLALPAAAFHVVLVFRFLHRPLFPAIEAALAPGGCLVYETFRRGQERFGSPTRPRFLLEDGELKRAFPGLRTLRYEETSPPAGPLMARLLARRDA